MDEFEKLKELSQMKTYEEVVEFENLFHKLAERKDEETLSKLMDFFDDNCEIGGIMYSMIHIIERYPMDIYILTLISKIGKGLEKYPTLLKSMIYGVINHDKYYDFFLRNIQFAEESSFKGLIENIKEDIEIIKKRKSGNLEELNRISIQEEKIEKLVKHYQQEKRKNLSPIDLY